MQSGRGWTKRGREGKKGRRGKEKRRKGRAEGECIGTENRVGREWKGGVKVGRGKVGREERRGEEERREEKKEEQWYISR